MATKFEMLEWSLVAGPLALSTPVFPSDHVTEDVVEYQPAKVAEALSALAGVEVVVDNGDWWEWKAEYFGDGDCFEINLTLFETEPPLWAGSDLVGATNPEEALRFWSALDRVLPGTYLHSSDAELFTFDGFWERFLADRKPRP